MIFLDHFRPQIEAEIREIVYEGRSPLLGLDVMYCYHMGLCDRDGNPQDLPKGKYLRPLMCLAMCAALGGDPKKAIPAAASLELGHRCTLIFDDIQDKGVERNNRTTVWTIWGSDQAMNAGLALSAYARLALLRLRQQEVPDDTVLKVWMVLEKTTIDLCQGQYRDISLGTSSAVTVGDYLGMVRGKTASLFGACCDIGALCAGTENKVVDLAREFGIQFGLAFQAHDDYLGIWGDEVEVGKTANDLMEKKRTLPVVLALEMAPGYPQTDHYTIERWLSHNNIRPEEAAIFKNWMEDRGIPQKVLEMETDFIGQARERLNALPLSSKWHRELNDLLTLSTRRQK